MSEFRDFHTMQTKSGRTFTPLDDYDVLEVIYDEMGQDVHDFVAGRILEIDTEENIAQQKFNSDFRAIEGENEAWHQFVDDISEELEGIRKQIEDNKLTKARISVELYKIYEKMRKEL